MANYSVTRYSSTPGSLTAALSALETKLETIVNTKTIRYINIEQIKPGSWVALLIYDT